MADATLPTNPQSDEALPRTSIDVESEIQDLHKLVSEGTTFLNHGVWLDLNEFEARIERILNQLPKELKRARRVAQEEQRILADARDEAARVIAEARTEADAIVAGAQQKARGTLDESALRQAAVQEAEEIMRLAQQNANEIRDRAFAYGRDMLASLQVTVENAREQIRLGQEQLAPPGG